MKSERRGKPLDPAEVDLAPLIDITFLLIVFFMSIWQAAHIEVAAHLQLPTVSQGDPKMQQDLDRLIVNVDKFGHYYVSNQRYDQAGLRDLLAREAKASLDAEGWAKRPVFIRADEHLGFGHVQDVLQICREVHIWRLSLRNRPRKGGT